MSSPHSPFLFSRRRALGALAGLALGGPAAAQELIGEPPPGFVELHRLRLVNRKAGPIQVSTDGGETWQTLGRVLEPATTATEGYIAAEYAAPASVAAVAVHGIRLRVAVDDKTLHAPLVLSIVPREYSGAVNHGFGGHIAGSAGLKTDIPAGTSLFRDLAPIAGNPILTETNTGRLTALPGVFKPTGRGEVLVIPVWYPANPLTQLVIENKLGGNVEGTFADGATRILSRVVKPVQGVGRFDGTAYTGVGRINTAHTGVITVSTAPIDSAQPEGQGKERRGGFQISPAWHNARCEERDAPMMLILGEIGEDGKPKPRRRLLEGTAPLFRDMISVAGQTPQVDCKIDEGDWEPLPAVVGARMEALTGEGLTNLWREAGRSRTARQGVTALRIRLPERTPTRSIELAERELEGYRQRRLAAAKASHLPIVRGMFTFRVSPTDPGSVAFVRLLVEGIAKAFSNVAPFELQWDTTRVANGEYLIEVELLDSGGTVLRNKPFRVYVDNSRPAVSSAGGE